MMKSIKDNFSTILLMVPVVVLVFIDHYWENSRLREELATTRATARVELLREQNRNTDLHEHSSEDRKRMRAEIERLRREVEELRASW